MLPFIVGLLIFVVIVLGITGVGHVGYKVAYGKPCGDPLEALMFGIITTFLLAVGWILYDLLKVVGDSFLRSVGW